MYIGLSESSHFSFVAVGNTEEDVVKTFRCGWRAHCKMMRIPFDKDYVDELIDGLLILPIKPGDFYTDEILVKNCR